MSITSRSQRVKKANKGKNEDMIDTARSDWVL